MINIKNTFWLLIAILISTKSFSQQEPSTDFKSNALNNWYIEMGGSAMFYSLNYEKFLFKTDNTALVGRVGLGFNPYDYNFLNKVYLDNNTFMAPFTSQFLFGRGKEKFEIGLGFTLLAQNIDKREIVPTGVIGFRVIDTKRILLRICYSPFIRNGQYIDWWGVSLGKNFNFK
jgi:hypothetical protein